MAPRGPFPSAVQTIVRRCSGSVSHICGFISSAVYEDRLGYQAYTASRVLTGKVPEWLDRPAGLFYVPVEHEGNIYESAEEEDRIASLMNDLLHASVCSAEGAMRRLIPDDILIVAPYNLQVRRLERRLPGIRVGSVDKFQGQEAAVVILSMCASAGDLRTGCDQLRAHLHRRTAAEKWHVFDQFQRAAAVYEERRREAKP